MYADRYSASPAGHGRALTVVLSILAVLLAAAAVLSWMALHDPYAGKGLDSVAPSDAAVKQLMQSAVTGKECSFTADQTNGLLSYLMQKYKKSEAASGSGIQAAAVASASGNSADVYVPVRYRGRTFGVLLRVTPALSSDGTKLEFRVDSARVGLLTVPKGWLLKAAAKKLPEDFTLEGDTVSCPCPSLTLSVLNFSGTVKIASMSMEDGMLKIGAKAALSVTGG